MIPMQNSLLIAYHDIVKDRSSSIENTVDEDVLYRKKRAIDHSSGPAEFRVLNFFFSKIFFFFSYSDTRRKILKLKRQWPRRL